jgi:hypothetical protein
MVDCAAECGNKVCVHHRESTAEAKQVVNVVRYSMSPNVNADVHTVNRVTAQCKQQRAEEGEPLQVSQDR